MSVEENFNAAAAIYDSVKYLPGPAERTAANAGLKAGQRVLGVACGTGFATMAAARFVGRTGKVIGIDIADKLLDKAKEKALASGLKNVEYFVGDARSLEFDDNSFDSIICASSIFLFSNIPQALQEWLRVLKPGGKAVFSTFGKDTFQPIAGLYSNRLKKYGKETVPLPALSTPKECREILTRAGFENIEVVTEQLGFYLTDKQECWQQLSSSLAIRPLLTSLNAEEQERFKKEHFLDLEPLLTDKGIWIDMPINFGIGEKHKAA